MSNKAIAEEYRKIAEDLVLAHKGEITVTQALTQNGVSEKQARKGWALVKNRKSLNAAFEIALKDELLSEAINIKLDLHEERALIDNRLYKNILTGKDEAVQSTKLLGQRKDLNLWTPDNLSQYLILNVPKGGIPELPSKVDSQVIDVQSTVVHNND